jgi:hypothetical protein
MEAACTPTTWSMSAIRSRSAPAQPRVDLDSNVISLYSGFNTSCSAADYWRSRTS